MFRVFVRGQGSATSLDFTLYCTLLMKAMRNRGEYIQNLKTEEKKILLKKKKKKQIIKLRKSEIFTEQMLYFRFPWVYTEVTLKAFS